MVGHTPSIFQFKQFRVLQSDSVFKIGTDAVLLGAWVNVTGACRILDVGTGTGILALMCAQRNPIARISAIDAEAAAVALSRENFYFSPWKDRLTARHEELNAQERETYDLVISNPPYFQRDLKSSSRVKAYAKHVRTLSYRDLIYKSGHLLSEEGRLAMIYPAKLEYSIIEFAALTGLQPVRLLRVHAVCDKAPYRILIELTSNREKRPCEQGHLTMFFDAGRTKTPEYRKLVDPFYL